MDNIAQRLKAYIEAHPFDPSDSNYDITMRNTKILTTQAIFLSSGITCRMHICSTPGGLLPS